ncbi:hypothetical protein ACFXPV_29255 [Streptomyces sp. NPDC059118]|uniref:hypothetical protein n=1 Tax=unclassified Streptomyces TaxID=2593676 RepID=UPI0036960B5B
MLRNLFWLSGLTVPEVADLTSMRPSHVKAILNGDVVPAWPTTFMVVSVMRGSPDDVRWLWEWARGQRPRCPVSHAGAMDHFQAALRGLRLASTPGTAARNETEARLLQEEQGLPGVLDSWERARELIEGFGASAERFQPLWEQARRAALSAPEFLSLDEDGDGAEME